MIFSGTQNHNWLSTTNKELLDILGDFRKAKSSIDYKDIIKGQNTGKSYKDNIRGQYRRTRISIELGIDQLWK